MQQGYFLGLGSNLQPELNTPLMLAALTQHFGTLYLSPVIRTPPIGMEANSEDFLNSVAYIEGPYTEPELKAVFNQIEAQLGRDRSDPLRKVKSRPADIDVLLIQVPEQAINIEQVPGEAHLWPCFEALAQGLSKLSYTPRPHQANITGLSLGGQAFGEQNCEFSRLDDGSIQIRRLD